MRHRKKLSTGTSPYGTLNKRMWLRETKRNRLMVPTDITREIASQNAAAGINAITAIIY
jgi:hypothetical protein